MTNAFHWQGRPSIFTSGRDWSEYGATTTQKHRNLSMKRKAAPVDLPGGSMYPAPDLMKGKKNGRPAKVRDME